MSELGKVEQRPHQFDRVRGRGLCDARSRFADTAIHFRRPKGIEPDPYRRGPADRRYQAQHSGGGSSRVNPGGYRQQRAPRAERSGFCRAFVCHENPALRNARTEKWKAPFWLSPISMRCCAARRTARAGDQLALPAQAAAGFVAGRLARGPSAVGEPMRFWRPCAPPIGPFSNTWRRKTGNPCGDVCVGRLRRARPLRSKFESLC